MLSHVAQSAGPPETDCQAADEPPASEPTRGRNRERVLLSAEAVFAEQGLAVPIDEIARHAGVGVGTVYRHFPTKEALYEAIVVRHVDALAAMARAERTDCEAGAVFFEFLSRIATEAHSKRDLTEALASAGVDVKAIADSAFSDLRSAVGTLLTKAQQCGSVRSDVAPDEVFALVGGVCMGAGHDGAPPVNRMVALVCDALRPPAR